MIKALIFDKDGTLFDFQATWGAWAGTVLDDLAQGDAALLARLAAVLDYDLTARALTARSLVVAGTPREIVTAIAPDLPGWTADALYDHLNDRAAKAPQVEVVPLAPFFAGLKSAGLKVAVMTNDAERPAKANLAAHLDVLDMVVGSDSGFGAKPDPDPLLAIARHLDLPPQACAMVGDSTHDLHAGHAAGMTTIAVLTGLAPRDVLAPHADVVLDTIGDIPAWLEAAAT